MSKIPFPRRKPIAGFGARVFRKVRPLIDIATTALLIALLAFPASVVPPHKTEAAPAPVPHSAPPEPFVTHNGSGFTSLTASILSTASNAIAALAPATLPAGLENAKMPTIAERLVSKAGLAASLSTKSAIEPPPQPSSVVDFDFDNDGKTDVGRWHAANTELKVKNSNGGSYLTFTVGSSSAILAPGDFNGDGKTDAAVFSAGMGTWTWTYKTSPSASAQTISWGASGDVPVAGDYDGDGTTDAAIYRPSTNTWWILKSSGGSTSTSFGSAGDVVAPGDYS